MTVFYFLLADFLFLLSFPVLLLGSYYFMKRKIDRALSHYLTSRGCQVSEINATREKFAIKSSSPKVGIRFGATLIKGGAGSGVQYREVTIVDKEGNCEKVIAAVELRYFSPVGFHLKTD